MSSVLATGKVPSNPHLLKSQVRCSGGRVLRKPTCRVGGGSAGLSRFLGRLRTDPGLGAGCWRGLAAEQLPPHCSGEVREGVRTYLQVGCWEGGVGSS